MTDRTPVITAAELATLNSDEIVEGYMDCLNGEPEPGANRSKAYWHGYQNAMRDRGNLPTTDAQIALIKDCRRVHGNDITTWGRAA